MKVLHHKLCQLIWGWRMPVSGITKGRVMNMAVTFMKVL